MNRDISLFLLISWPYFLNDLYLIPLSKTSQLGLLWTLDIVFYCLVPITTLFILYRKGQFKPDHIGLNRLPPLSGVAIAVIVALLSYIILTMNLGPWLFANGCCRTCLGYAFPSADILKWITIIYAAVSAAFLEEIIFRGILITTLKKYIQRKWVIVILSCLIFTFIHWCGGSGKLIFTFLAGLVFTFLYLRRGRLAEPIICHMIVDFLAFM